MKPTHTYEITVVKPILQPLGDEDSENNDPPEVTEIKQVDGCAVSLTGGVANDYFVITDYDNSVVFQAPASFVVSVVSKGKVSKNLAKVVSTSTDKE